MGKRGYYSLLLLPKSINLQYLQEFIIYQGKTLSPPKEFAKYLPSGDLIYDGELFRYK